MTTLEQRQREREKRHRNREIAIAILLVLVVFIGTWAQTSYFGSDSWLFLVLLNVNAILVLVVFYLTVRNIVKLLAERRRKVFGSRLRTRLLLAFGTFSFIPVLLMYLAANRVVITSIDYWFTNTVASSMEAALDVGQSVYSNSVNRISARVDYIIADLNSQLDGRIDSEEELVIIDEYFAKNEGILTGNILALVDLTDASARLRLTTLHTQETSFFLQDVIRNLPWSHVANQSYSSLFTLGEQDYVVIVKALAPKNSSYIVLAESIGNAAQSNLEGISKGFDDYAYLKSLNQPLQLSFSLILGLLGLLMVFSAIVMAFRLSKELTAPVEALARGTSRIKEGDLDVFLEDSGQDELGHLVSSFNSMTSQVRETNENIQRTNVELGRRNVFIENVLENIATGVCVFTHEGWIVSINKAAAQILDVKESVWSENNLFINVPEQDIFLAMHSHLEKNPDKRWRKELEIKNNLKQTKVLFTAFKLPQFIKMQTVNSKDDEQFDKNIVLLIEDITEVTRGERLAAWREVARRIAHEMKNPLTPIRLSAERLQKKFNSQNEEPVFSECTKLIINEVERMQEMINNFTAYAKMPEVVLQEENIMKLISENLQTYRTSYVHIEWIMEVSEDFENSHCRILNLHAQTFKQALMNIYLNAADAVKGVEKPKIITSISCTPDTCILSISDNGQGFSEEALTHMFEPYFTKKQEGTGLGLSIAQSILADHNATIHAQNNALGGASVIVTLHIG